MSNAKTMNVKRLCYVLFAFVTVAVLAEQPIRSHSRTTNRKSTLRNWQDAEYRLPRNSLPTTYVVRLLPFVDGDSTIDGHVDVFVDCVNSTHTVTLNSLNISIDISNTKVLDVDAQASISVADFIDEQSTVQMITLKTKEQLKAGKKYKISIPFTSYLNDNKEGFYRSSYVESGIVKHMAITHMEPADARRVFPCFDEPDMKAKFSIVLGRKSTMVSFSNMPLLGSNANLDLPGYYWDYYETSVDMSTYLIALVVSDFKITPSDPALSNVHFRVVSRPDAQNSTEYAADIGPRMLEFYEDYFGIDYTLVKMDMAAAPDFPAGAMENWGLMVFQEEFILYDNEKSSSWNKQLVAEVISHELVHQWFGNLVTMKWWDNIWLNEGFARYIQMLAVEAVEPDYKIILQFPVEYLQPALIVDARVSSHPMSQPDDLEDIFDEIEYDKGASVLRMCADFLGAETFRNGLHRYLIAHQFSNTVEEDLWQSLNEQVLEDGVALPASVNDIMQTWTQQENYPLVTVQRNSDGIFVKQDHFVLDENGQLVSRENQKEDEYLWWLPLTFTQSFESDPQREWISQRNATLTAKLEADQWIVFNVEQMGFYRVLYEDGNYALIKKQMIEDLSKISPINRAQLMDDALNLASAGALSYAIALDLVSFLAKEKEYYPWAGAVDELDYIETMLYNQQIHPDWKTFLSGLAEPFYSYIGFEESESDEHMIRMSRTLISRWACRLGVDDCVRNAADHYKVLMNEPSSVLPPDQRETILRTGIENGGKLEYDFALQQYRDAGDVGFLIAATFTKQSSLIYNLLDEMIALESFIQRNDIDAMFQSLASNSLGNVIALEYLETHWNAIEQSLGTDYFPRFFEYLCRISNTQSQKDKLIKLRDGHSDILNGTEEVERGLATVDRNLFWLGKYLEDIAYFLSGTQPEPTPSSSTGSSTISSTSFDATSASTSATTTPSSASDSKEKSIVTAFSALVLALVL